jgi:hypothetical protein
MHRLLTCTGQKYDFLSVHCKVNSESHCAPTKVLEKLHIRYCYRFNMITLPYAGYTIQTEFTRNIRSPDRVYNHQFKLSKISHKSHVKTKNKSCRSNKHIFDVLQSHN